MMPRYKRPHVTPKRAARIETLLRSAAVPIEERIIRGGSAFVNPNVVLRVVYTAQVGPGLVVDLDFLQSHTQGQLHIGSKDGYEPASMVTFLMPILIQVLKTMEVLSRIGRRTNEILGQ